MGPCKPHEAQQGQVQGPLPEPKQYSVSIKTGGWMDWEQSCQEGLGDADGWKAGYDPWVHAHFPQSQLCLGLQKKCGW